MANLTETANWEPGIYQLERVDLWDAGVAGSGIANLAVQQLTNRSVYLKAAVDKINAKINFNLNVGGPVICGNAGTIFMDGSAYSFVYPITFPDYTTPNDGITRNYEITISCFANFTYGASANVQMVLFTTGSGPSLQPLITANLRQPYQPICYKKVISLLPNTRVKVYFGNNATGANATFTDCSLQIKEL